MKNTKFLTVITCMTMLFTNIRVNAQIPSQVEHFDIKDVRLTESAFKKAQDMDIRYLLSLDPD